MWGMKGGRRRMAMAMRLLYGVLSVQLITIRCKSDNLRVGFKLSYVALHIFLNCYWAPIHFKNTQTPIFFSYANPQR